MMKLSLHSGNQVETFDSRFASLCLVAVTKVRWVRELESSPKRKYAAGNRELLVTKKSAGMLRKKPRITHLFALGGNKIIQPISIGSLTAAYGPVVMTFCPLSASTTREA